MATRQAITLRNADSVGRNSVPLSAESPSKNQQAMTPGYLKSIMCFSVAVTALSTATFILHAQKGNSIMASYPGFWSALPSLPAGTSSAAPTPEPARYPPVPASPTRIFAPSLRGADALPHENRTVFVFTERCTQRNNYSCKFWFHLRCLVLAAFPNVVALPSRGWVAMLQFEREVKPGDIALLPWRRLDRSPTPEPLRELLAWRAARARADDARGNVRVGVFHFANEYNRTYWPWYPKADFVLRNYWTNRTSPHVQYIPLGGQVPEACPSDRAGDSAHFQTLPADRPSDRATNGSNWRDGTMPNESRRRDACACDGVKLASLHSRRYLWSFSGSLQKGRRRLVAQLRNDSALFKRGRLQVAGRFGGDGEVGSGGRNDTKTAYLETVMASQMVFCPCGGAMETHRIYEALNHGAVPVIEKCEKDERADFFPFGELMIDDGITGLVDFVRRFADDKAGLADLQERVMAWWRAYSTEVALNVTRVMLRDVPERVRSTM